MTERPISGARHKGKPLSPEADALALRVAKMVAKARGTHTDKFTALVAVMAALGVADEMYADDCKPS